MLWLLLASDWQSALMWAVKAPSPRYWIDGTVRWEKVALCLAWSFSVFLFYACRYGMAARAIIALLASVLLVQGANAVLKINMADIPYLYLVNYFVLEIIWFFAPLLIAAVLACVIWTKRAFVQTHVRIASAVTLGACATMAWIGLFDVIYPGIGWR